jgi:hypothetical protein
MVAYGSSTLWTGGCGCCFFVFASASSILHPYQHIIINVAAKLLMTQGRLHATFQSHFPNA